MAKKQGKLAKQLEHLEGILRKLPEGASLATLLTKYGEPIPERTLQRYLTTLQLRGNVRVTGARRSTRYHWVTPTEPAFTTSITGAAGAIIPFSPEGEAVRQHLQQPEVRRQPVGYKAEFLQDYEPNVSYYLTAGERGKLLRLGQTNTGEQPAGTYARQILQRLLIDLSWNSSRLEGNTYSLLDTQRLLALGQTAAGKSVMEAQMILNHKEAIEFLVDSAGEIGFNRYTITNLHGLLSHNLLPASAASGRLRTHGVGIHGSVYAPLAIPQLIEENFETLLTKADAIQDPFEQSFFAMVHIPYLQPFDDVNKRVSRLAANIPLNRHNLAPLSFIDVPQDLYIQGLLGVYELQVVGLLKDIFLWAYERSCINYATLRQTLGEPDRFRMEHRDAIRGLVQAIVTENLPQEEAQWQIESAARGLPAGDQRRFVEVIESELLSLHSGNIARYRIRPSEFDAWQDKWNGKEG